VSSPFGLSGPDTSLSLEPLHANTTNSPTYNLVFTTSDNFPYPLRSVSVEDGHDAGHPGRIWTNESTSSHDPLSITLPAQIRIETDVVNGSRVWIQDEFAGRFEVFVFGGRNTVFSWSQMALVAPLDEVKGGIDSLLLEAGIGNPSSGNGTNEFPDSPFQGGTERFAGHQAWLITWSMVLFAFYLST